MKVVYRLVCGVLLAGMALSGCAKKDGNASGPAAGKRYSIGFIQLIDNVTFKEMRDGFYARMAERGYGEDRLTINYKDAQGDTATLNTICQEMGNAKYDVVVTLATPATQAFVNLESAVPNIFISVADPVAAGVLTSMEKPDKNATGTSNFIPVSELFKLADKITPGIKRYGMIYNFGEVNAVSTINKAKEYLDSTGITYQEITVTNSSEVQQAAEALAPRIDAFFIPNDSMVVSAMSQIVEAANSRKIPVYGTALAHVNSGALATVGISDALIGARSADMVIRYLEGTPIENMPAVTFDTLYTIINKATADTIGIVIPAEFASAALIGK
ncbi:MAG: ABC transporter substrate-binding protein [Treponema sp.]|jgi:putative ABC transport system substrate-binding protein|nr:ABC transporter substrate-binding protein [Treponema sp.]